MGKTSPAEIDICEGKVCKRLWHTYETHERQREGGRGEAKRDKGEGVWCLENADTVGQKGIQLDTWIYGIFLSR